MGTPASRRRWCSDLERFPSDARFITDDPGLVWRSGHDTPGDFADTSYQRLDDHSITQASLVKAASADDVCGVVVTSPAHFGRLGGLPDALAAHDYHPVQFGHAHHALRARHVVLLSWSVRG